MFQFTVQLCDPLLERELAETVKGATDNKMTNAISVLAMLSFARRFCT